MLPHGNPVVMKNILCSWTQACGNNAGLSLNRWFCEKVVAMIAMTACIGRNKILVLLFDDKGQQQSVAVQSFIQDAVANLTSWQVTGATYLALPMHIKSCIHGTTYYVCKWCYGQCAARRICMWKVWPLMSDTLWYFGDWAQQIQVMVEAEAKVTHS